MELNWLESILYGLLSGFTEFLPVSAIAHQTVLLKLLGKQPCPAVQFAATLGAFAAVFASCFNALLRLRRERRIASLPKKRRRRQPDFSILMESKVFRLASVFMLLGFIAYPFVYEQYQRLWVLAILLGVNGIVLYLPQYQPSANKSAQSLSGLDALLIGLSAACGVVPGVSRMACAIGAGRVRGGEKRYSVELALLLSIPALAVLAVIYLVDAVSAGAFSAALAVNGVLAALSSFAAGYFAIVLVRYLAVRAGFSGFAYYCWGLALFTLIIYLI